MLFYVYFIGLILSQLCEVRAYGKKFHNATIDPLIEGDQRQIFRYEQTIVIRDLTPESAVRRCNVIEVYNNETEFIDNESIVLFFLPEYELQETTMNGMINILSSCDSVDDQSFLHDFLDAVRPYAKVVRAISPFIFGSQSMTDELKVASKEISSAVNKVWSNIVPRTKWCGRGNVAESFHDLGELRAIDRCCRSHDFCPIKILGNDEMYGLKNEKDFTISHCVCDFEFYNCLKATKQYSAGQVGLLYFSYLRPNCIEGFPPNDSVSPENTDNVMRLVPVKRTWYGSGQSR